MQPETAKYLKDMLEAIASIEQSVADKSLADYEAEKPVRDIVHWNFCVLGEALSQLEKKDAAVAGLIGDRRKIIGLRNQLIHGYAVIEHWIIWDIITVHLPKLRSRLEDMLK